MAQTDEILAELGSLAFAERLALVELEVQRLHQHLGQNEKEDIWQGRTIQELAERQGVRPVQDLDSLLADFWPPEESVDEFLTAIREWRGDERAT